MKNYNRATIKHPIHVKKGDKVVVMSGKDKGKSGYVTKVITKKNKVVVEGINMITKAQKPNPMAGIQGGLVKKEAPLFASKVMLCCPVCGKVTRIKHDVVEGKKVRVCKKCGQKVDV